MNPPFWLQTPLILLGAFSVAGLVLVVIWVRAASTREGYEQIQRSVGRVGR